VGFVSVCICVWGGKRRRGRAGFGEQELGGGGGGKGAPHTTCTQHDKEAQQNATRHWALERPRPRREVGCPSPTEGQGSRAGQPGPRIGSTLTHLGKLGVELVLQLPAAGDVLVEGRLEGQQLRVAGVHGIAGRHGGARSLLLLLSSSPPPVGRWARFPLLSGLGILGLGRQREGNRFASKSSLA
jgi:hypothetical protein